MRISNEPKDKSYKFRVSYLESQKIEEFSKKKGISISELIRRAIDMYINNK